MERKWRERDGGLEGGENPKTAAHVNYRRGARQNDLVCSSAMWIPMSSDHDAIAVLLDTALAGDCNTVEGLFVQIGGYDYAIIQHRAYALGLQMAPSDIDGLNLNLLLLRANFLEEAQGLRPQPRGDHREDRLS